MESEAFLVEICHTNKTTTGESYGGHYIPQLAAKILDDTEFYKQLNMKGFWIGNPGLVSSTLGVADQRVIRFQHNVV